MLVGESGAVPQRGGEAEVMGPPSNATAASAGAGMIDDFRLRGSRTWRRMGGHLTNGRWLTEVAHQVAHAFDHHNASLSEGTPLAAVVGALPGKPYGTRVGTDSPGRLRQSEARLRLARPRFARRVMAPHREGEKVVRATPSFLALVRHRGGVNGPP